MSTSTPRAIAFGRTAVAVAAIMVLAACGSPSASVDPTPETAGTQSTESTESTESTDDAVDEAALAGDLTVFAAASLTDSFTAIGERFTQLHPDVAVTFNFGGSSGLAAQITSGAPADVFAAASPGTMATVVDAGDAAGPAVVFTRNTLQIVTPADNPGNVAALVDLSDPARTIALCAPEVPCGSASATVFAAAGLTPAPDTLEQDVRATLNKVVLGEVDAALVYRTDVLAAGEGVLGIDFAESADAVNDYLITALADAPEPGTARAFIDFVLGPQGQQVLVDAGFTAL